jgi:hypothetical protein
MNFLLGKKYGIPSQIVVKKMFCAKKVTKLLDLTVLNICLWILLDRFMKTYKAFHFVLECLIK